MCGAAQSVFVRVFQFVQEYMFQIFLRVSFSTVFISVYHQPRSFHILFFSNIGDPHKHQTYT